MAEFVEVVLVTVPLLAFITTYWVLCNLPFESKVKAVRVEEGDGRKGLELDLLYLK